MYTAAAHCQLIVTPGVSEVIVPLQVTGLSPPGIFAGTKYENAERNVFPASPVEGTVVVGILPAQVIVAVVEGLGLMMTVAFPGERLNAELVIDWLVNRIVTGWFVGSPLGFNTLVNQT